MPQPTVAQPSLTLPTLFFGSFSSALFHRLFTFLFCYSLYLYQFSCYYSVYSHLIPVASLLLLSASSLLHVLLGLCCSFSYLYYHVLFFSVLLLAS